LGVHETAKRRLIDMTKTILKKLIIFSIFLKDGGTITIVPYTVWADGNPPAVVTIPKINIITKFTSYYCVILLVLRTLFTHLLSGGALLNISVENSFSVLFLVGAHGFVLTLETFRLFADLFHKLAVMGIRSIIEIYKSCFGSAGANHKHNTNRSYQGNNFLNHHIDQLSSIDSTIFIINYIIN